ncbi:DUF3772 domain-containing protein [Sulfitobacter aestuarii]|uniref:DUF3772 domain-containing protein n=2 Tax=Sulfitobacter aestuarii TaxID=2161676 RepID=A0ABW5U5P2_9RHOB
MFMRFMAPLVLAMTLAFGSAALAQPDIESEGWDRLASQAEEQITAETVDEETLEALRAEIAAYRSRFEVARGQNADRIKMLREQIAALGVAPEGEGAEEPADVAAKREELTDQLNTLLAPVQTAEAAFLEADGLIRQIDQIMRERQARALLSLSPSPLNPANWGPAFSDLMRGYRAVWEPAADQKSSGDWQSLRGNLPVVVMLTLAGLVLLFRGRNWAAAIVGRLRRYGARGIGIWRFVVSLLRILLPFCGLLALVGAARITGYLGPRGDELLRLIPLIGGLMLGFRWISERVFARDDDEALLPVAQRQRKQARFFVSLITGAIIIDVVLSSMLSFVDSEPASRIVVSFLPALLASFALFGLGKILHSYSDEPTPGSPVEETRISTLSRVVRGLGLGAMLVAVLAPLLMAAGYFTAGEALQQPYIVSLALLGLVMALQRFLADVYGAVTGQGIAAREALMPVLFGLLLLLLVMPLLALAWGARVTDLTELWGAFSRGFTIGESRISPTDFLTFAVIFALGYVITRILQGALRNNVLPKTRIDIGGQNAIVSGLGYVGIFLAALLAITGAGIDLSSLAIVAGALSVGIGFGLQNIVSNFVSGIILLIERPISEGDWIEVGGQMGYVRDISVRSTRIETFDRTDVIVPNADLVSGTVTNFTRGNTVGRLIVAVGVAYGSDTRHVEAVLKEIAEAQPMVLASPPPTVVFQSFGADALEFEIRAILRDVNFTNDVKNNVNHAIAQRFAEEGIEIPFAQRDIWLRNPEALQGSGTT